MQNACVLKGRVYSLLPSDLSKIEELCGLNNL